MSNHKLSTDLLTVIYYTEYELLNTNYYLQLVPQACINNFPNFNLCHGVRFLICS